MDGLSGLDELRAHFGPMSDLVARKVLPRLDRFSRSFIAMSPFLVLATADGEGGVDASPRGDAAGFVQVRDDATLVLPDRPGNRRVDSFSNVIRNAGVGILFMVPGINETLRVNGRGRVVTDPTLLEPLSAHGKTPVTGLVIDIDEVFFHCGKALIRSKLWDPAEHVDRKNFPSLGEVIAEQTAAMTIDAAEQAIAVGYRDRLY
jgi:PPOX class probable FMN-dependent enzyme